MKTSIQLLFACILLCSAQIHAMEHKTYTNLGMRADAIYQIGDAQNLQRVFSVYACDAYGGHELAQIADEYFYTALCTIRRAAGARLVVATVEKSAWHDSEVTLREVAEREKLRLQILDQSLWKYNTTNSVVDAHALARVCDEYGNVRLVPVATAYAADDTSTHRERIDEELARMQNLKKIELQNIVRSLIDDADAKIAETKARIDDLRKVRIFAPKTINHD